MFLLIAAFPSPLLLVENASVGVMSQAVMRNSGTTRWVDRLPFKTRLCTTDGHPSNKATERQLSHNRPGWLAVWIWCELHLVAILFKESLLSMCVPFTKGVLYTGLVLTHGENLTVFRQCLFDEIVSRLDICFGAPTPAATAYIMSMIRLFAGTVPQMTKVLVYSLPNGDWEKDDRVEWYPPEHLKPDDINVRSLANVFATMLIKCFQVQCGCSQCTTGQVTT